MTILLLGATGATGRHVLAQALERDHRVVAYVRHAAKLTLSHERLRIIEGQLDDDNT